MRTRLLLCFAACTVTPAMAGSELPQPHAMGMFPAKGPALAVVSSDVAIDVHGPIVEVSVTQQFKNDTEHTTEATYIFPLPPDAAVSAMSIQTGARTIHASIESRAAAQKRYEDAISSGVGAALLEQERPDVFTQTVSAIPAHATVAVTLRYDTVAAYHDGSWQLAMPMVVAPRYVPGTASGQPTTGAGNKPDTDRAPDASRVTPLHGPNAGGATKVAMHFTDAVDGVTSPTHEVAAQGKDFGFTDAHSDHDAIVRWHAKSSARGWSEADGEAGYAAVVVEAPPARPRAAGTALEVTLVLDRSAAEHGDADAIEHPLVHRLLDGLGPKDTIAIGGSDKIAREAPADARRDVDHAWGTKTAPFDLTRVLKDLRGTGGAIVLVTTGLVADDKAAIAAATAIGAPVHVLGVGSAPNRALLAAIATATNGTVRVLAPDDDLAAVARDVLADAASPPAALTVTWGTLAASDVVPANLPRLGAGQARLVLARVAKAQAANGRAAGEVFAIVDAAATAPPLGATTRLGPLARRWARDRLDELLAATKPDVNAITAHAMKFGLVSPYTAMVAIGDEVVEKGGVKHSVTVPVSVPAGMKWQEIQRQNHVEIHDETEKETGKDGKDQRTVEKPAKTEVKDREQNRDADNRKTGTPKPADTTTIDPDGDRGDEVAKNDRRERKPQHHDVDKDDDQKPIQAKADHKQKGTPAPTPNKKQPQAPPHRPQPQPGNGGVPATTSVGGGAPSPSPAPPPVVSPEATKAPTLDAAESRDYKIEGEDDGGDGDASRAPAEERARVATASREDSLELQAGSLSETVVRRVRFGLSLGAGIAAQGSDVDSLAAVSLHVETHKNLTLLGLEASLWLVGGDDVQGRFLATLARRFGHFELGGGVGLHLGDGAGPAYSLSLRRDLARHFDAYLRFDGAVELHDSTPTTIDSGTAGIEWRW